jgi:hypothetical protein
MTEREFQTKVRGAEALLNLSEGTDTKGLGPEYNSTSGPISGGQAKSRCSIASAFSSG